MTAPDLRHASLTALSVFAVIFLAAASAQSDDLAGESVSAASETCPLAIVAEPPESQARAADLDPWRVEFGDPLLIIDPSSGEAGVGSRVLLLAPVDMETGRADGVYEAVDCEPDAPEREPGAQ